MSGKTPSSSHRGRRLAWAIAALAVAVLFTAGMILALDYLAKRRLLDRLAHGSNKEKVDAIKVLAERGSIRAIPELLKLTEDIEQINPRPVCSAANEAIQQIIQKRGDPAVHALATCLNQKTYERFRFFALDILQEIGPHGKAAIPVLTDFVDDKKPSIRIAAARALFEMGVEKKVFLPALLLAFHQVDPQELFFAISAVDWMEIPLPSLLPKFIDYLKWDVALNWPDEVDFTRHLLAIGKEAIPPVHELLKDGDPRVRVAATRLLGEFGAVAAAAVPALLELVDDASINQRAAAIEAIGRIKPNTKLALPAIARHLEDKDEYVRIKAMKAIFEYGREAQSLLPQITKQIKSHFRDPCVTVSIWAAAATMAIEPKEAKALLPEILAVLPHWRDGGWKNAAIEALGKLGPLARVAVPLLSEICFKDDKDDDSTAVSTKTALIAAKALGRIVATGEDLGPLLKMLQNPDPMRRAHAAAAFAAIGPGARLPPPILDQAIPHLLAATQDWSLAVRASARRALKEIASSKPRGS